ncbi:MAG: hypothetical protein NT124_02820 [Candidatus Dependentiae bacterium]|nr:hypothetical protein [Candidatus Dependentiae bacterium]
MDKIPYQAIDTTEGNNHNPSQLFIGQHSAPETYAIEYIQKKLCPHNGCLVCTTCRNIHDKQHHAMRWFFPEKAYTRDELAPLFQTLSFALDADELFFIVIEKADYLTAACANSLLKSIEEPPAGYHFLLLTDRPDQILPTIRSRCTTFTVQSTHIQSSTDPLFHLFTTSTPSDPSLFLKMLDKEKPTEQRSIALLDKLLAHWITSYKNALAAGDVDMQNNSQRVLNVLAPAIKHPPMPGSSKIMWKNLFLQIKK